MQMTLKAARVNAGYSVREAAALANVNKDTLSRWENGKRISKLDYIKLCHIYEIDPKHVEWNGDDLL